MILEKGERYFQILITLYNNTQAEITRYRDREWKNMSLFTASIAAVILFVVSNKEFSRGYPLLFDAALISLCLGNVFYTIFAHDRLTKQRNIKSRIEYLLNFSEIEVESKKLLPYDIEKPECNNFNKGWFRGFFSHLLPFFIAACSLAAFGIWFVHQ